MCVVREQPTDEQKAIVSIGNVGDDGGDGDSSGSLSSRLRAHTSESKIFDALATVAVTAGDALSPPAGGVLDEESGDGVADVLKVVVVGGVGDESWRLVRKKHLVAIVSP